MALHAVNLIDLTNFAKHFSMSDPAAPHPKSPVGRLIVLSVVILLGLALFFALARKTPVVARPADSEPVS